MPEDPFIGYRVERLSEAHDLAGFDCGVAVLNGWLTGRALRNQRSGASRTFAAVRDAVIDRQPICGYYSLAASAVALDAAPSRVRRNMPDPIPVVLLGRLAIDVRHQRSGLGAALLRDAVVRTARAAGSVGVRALLVHAIDERAAAFYRHFGFAPAPFDDQTLFLPLDRIRVEAERSGTSSGGDA